MKQDIKHLWYCSLGSLGLVAILWLIKWFEYFTETELYFLGIQPKTAAGLKGILTSHFIHADWDHLISNSLSLIILLPLMFYFYRVGALGIIALLGLMNGIWVWSFARESYHIGASGIIYGMIFFLFFAGFFSGSRSMKFISLLMVFVFGSALWAMLPFPNGVSWESHLMGALAGIICAWYFRKLGPQRETYELLHPESYEAEDEDEYWKIEEPKTEEVENPPSVEKEQNTIPPADLSGFNYKYIFKEKDSDDKNKS